MKIKPSYFCEMNASSHYFEIYACIMVIKSGVSKWLTRIGQCYF